MKHKHTLLQKKKLQNSFKPGSSIVCCWI